MIINIPFVSVVIPTYGEIGVELTARCLHSIHEAHDAIAPQLIVADDGSEDRVVNLLRDVCVAEGAELIHLSQNGGFAKACNAGLTRANGMCCFLVNNDVTFRGCPALQILADSMNIMQAGVIGGRLLYPDDTIQHGGVFFAPVEGQPIPGYFDHFCRGQKAWFPEAVTIKPSLVTGALFGMSRYAINSLGFLDERFEMAVEDIDWCLECITVGAVAYYNGYAWAYHDEGKTRGRTPEEKMALAPDKWHLEKEGLVKFFHKWKGVHWEDFSIQRVEQ